MFFRKGGLVGAVVLVVALVAFVFSGCVSSEAWSAAMEKSKNGPKTPAFGMKVDNGGGESMSVEFTTSSNPSSPANTFAFKCSYRGNQRPDALVLRIDNGSPIALRATWANSFNPGLYEFGITADIVNQLLNCNNRIDLQFNSKGDYIRNWDVSSVAEIKEYINYWKD